MGSYVIEDSNSIYETRQLECWKIASHKLEKFTKRKGVEQKITLNYGVFNNEQQQGYLCDISMKKQRETTCATQSVIIKSRNLSNILSSLILTVLLFCYCYHLPCLVVHCKPEPEPDPEPNPEANVEQTAQQQLTSTPVPAEYQLTSAVGDQTHIPCLIGRQLYCGEPYFIAWYKLNTSSRSWARIEHKSEEELLAGEQQTSLPSLSLSSSASVPTPFNERVRFTWWRAQLLSQQSATLPASSNSNQQRFAASQAKFACEQLSANGIKSSTLASSQQTHRFRFMKLDSNFDCATLTINSLELADEGQYKCEITFSDSVDFDKCPATTLSRLNVIAKPNEPELLVNGQRVLAGNNGNAYNGNNYNNNNNSRMLTFKEGAQVKLECQSSGGKPAPRIEWLNISSPMVFQSSNTPTDDDNRAGAGVGMDSISTAQQFTEVQLMRSFWPQKKATFSIADQSTPTGSHISQNHQQPITSSSVTFSLSRFDLRSHFVCLVLPATTISNDLTSSQALNNHLSQEQLIKNPAYLSTLFANQMRASASSNSHNLASTSAVGPMLKWIKLDIQVKPSSVRIDVRDVEADATLQPSLEWPQHSSPIVSLEPSQQPFYSLQANRLYAIQCLVDNSRPKSQIAWFNRTAPIEVATQTLDQASPKEYLIPSNNHSSKHRLSSYVHTIAHANGTFRTVSTLLLTTSIYDNFEELFCRVSNEAFPFDELIQVAPIISARLYVHFAPFAWLEADISSASSAAKWAKEAEKEAENEQNIADFLESPNSLSIEQGDQLVLRCNVAANPLAQNTILQIEWLKDGRKLTTAPVTTPNNNNQQQQLQSRTIQIERANHLHMPAASQIGHFEFVSGLSGSQSRQKSAANGNQLAASSKLIASSSLTINAISRQDSGSYSCHFKLIPAPSNWTPSKEASNQQHQQQQQIRITSGKAAQSIQVNVIEAKPKAPILRILSSKSLFVYGLDNSNSNNINNGQSFKAAQDSNPTGSKAALSTLLHHQKRPLTVVVPQQNALLSLKCDLPTKYSGINNKPSEIGHKIMWYLNGIYLHSSSSSLDVYNLTLDSLIALIGPSKPLGGIISCAHHFLSASSSPDNFHGSLMKIYQSLNEIDLKVRVEPKLVERRDLMPTIRSFSELELNANSASKLRLICMAECEPICSIDWYLNRQLLFGETATTTKTTYDKSHTLQEVATSLLDSNPAATANQTVLSRHCLHELPVSESGSSMMNFVENLIYRYNSSGRFTWLRETSFSSENQKRAVVAVHGVESSDHRMADYSDASKLMREADLQLSKANANVFSKFELTFNQIGQLLQRDQSQNSGEILLECKLNVMFGGGVSPNGIANHHHHHQQQQQLGYTFVEPQHWFPSKESFISSTLYQFAMSNDQQPLNLTTLFANTQDNSEHSDEQSGREQTGDANNESTKRWNDDMQVGQSPFSSPPPSSSPSNQQRSPANDMQIRILLDRAPEGASVSFAGIVSDSDKEPNGVSLSESQLLELADPNKLAPMIHCNVRGKVYPEVQFRWTFTDLNRTEHLITSESGSQLNLRQFVEFRQRQLNVNPMSAYGVELVSNIVGNYTCSVANIHGSRSATLMLRIQGRPLCKLTLANEYLSLDNELMVNLRCLVYSAPVLLETVWFKNNQQLGVNKTSLEVLSENWLKSPLSILEMPVMILNKQQDFLLSDFVTSQLANFKCIARNPLGYSEACELSQMDRQMLLKIYKPLGPNLAGSRPQSVEPIPNTKNNFLANASFIGDFPSGIGNSLFSSSKQQTSSTSSPSSESNPSLMRGLFGRIDWLLVIAFSLALLWLLFITGISFVRRKFGSSDPRKSRTTKGNTSWRFNPTTGASSSNEIVGLPFQSKVCVNYYGGSNGDSDHDMIQSCSQSSHYEDFAQHQQRLMMNQQQKQLHQQQLHQQQPVYFNSTNQSSTLTRRPLKSSMSSSSTGDSSTSSRQLARLNERIIQSGTLRDFSSIRQSQNKLAAANTQPRGGESLISESRHSDSSGFTLTSNIPLINGTQTSRIQLDHCQQPARSQQYRLHLRGESQQHYSNRNNEHIYDDVIYNQMIL